MPDSTKLHEVAIWKMWQLVKMAQEAIVADSTIKYQEKEIRKGLAFQMSCDSLLKIRKKEIMTKGEESLINFNLYSDELLLNGILKKEKAKWVKIAIAAIILLILETAILISRP